MQPASTARRPQPVGRTTTQSTWRDYRPQPHKVDPVEPEPINPWSSLGDAAARILAQLEVRR
jgi:hypothetical protein